MAVARFERLIANESAGAQMHLIYRFQKWQKSIGVVAAERRAALMRIKTEPDDEGPSTSARRSAEWSLKAILKSNVSGPTVVRYYEEHDALCKTIAKVLRDIICHYAHENFNQLSRSMCGQIITEIKQQFPNADSTEFEIDATTHYGALYTRYQSMYKKTERAIKREAGEADQAGGPKPKKSVDDTPTAVKAARRCAAIDPKKSEKYYPNVWRKSTNARHNDRHEMSTEQFLEEWPLYTQESGNVFMRIDFENWLGAPALSVDDEFEERFASNFLSAIERYKPLPKDAAKITDACKNGDTNAKIEIILRCLSQMFKPTAKEPNASRLYTSEESFATIIHDSVRVAPPRHHLIIVKPHRGGSPYILTLYDLKWKFKSLLQAVTHAVELFATLNLATPKVRRNHVF